MDCRTRIAALLAVLSAALLAACGSDDGTPYQPVEAEPLDDPAAYFGVTPCRCFEFEREDGMFDVGLGIAVESVGSTYAGALEGHGTDYHVLRYRRGSQIRRTDHLRPTDPDLLLAGVNFGSKDWENLIRIEPPVPFLRFPLDKQKRSVKAESSTQLSPAGNDQGEPEPMAFRADYNEAEVIASLDGSPSEPMSAIRVLYSNLPWPDVIRYYVPEQGLVKLDLDLQDGEGRKTWVLKRIRQLEGGCPWKLGDTIPPDQICGSN